MAKTFSDESVDRISKTVKTVEAQGRDESPDTPLPPGRAREAFALAKLTAAGASDGLYLGREVLGSDPTADPPTWLDKTPGRTFGVSTGDEGEILHPLLITGLEATSSGADPVYLIRRIVRRGGNPFWMIVGAPGGLPTPSAEYQTLVATGDPLAWVPDWVRAHA